MEADHQIFKWRTINWLDNTKWKKSVKKNRKNFPILSFFLQKSSSTLLHISSADYKPKIRIPSIIFQPHSISFSELFYPTTRFLPPLNSFSEYFHHIALFRTPFYTRPEIHVFQYRTSIFTESICTKAYRQKCLYTDPYSN